MQCPHCGAKVSQPATQGGVLVRNRYLRVTAKGELLIGCPGCKRELEAPSGARLVLYRTKPSNRLSSDSLGATEPTG